MAGKDFTADGEAADIGTVLAIGHGQFQETAPAKLRIDEYALSCARELGVERSGAQAPAAP